MSDTNERPMDRAPETSTGSAPRERPEERWDEKQNGWRCDCGPITDRFMRYPSNAQCPHCGVERPNRRAALSPSGAQPDEVAPFTVTFSEKEMEAAGEAVAGLAPHNRESSGHCFLNADVADFAYLALNAMLTNKSLASPSPLAAEGEAGEIERLAEVAHDAYEERAMMVGWATHHASRKPWSEVPEANRECTRAAVRAILRAAPSGQREEDGERLDALEALFAQDGGVMLFRYGMGAPDVCVQRWRKWAPPIHSDDPFSGPTLRTAIDAARSRPTTGKAE